MNIKIETEATRKDNDRITLANVKRDGYTISNIEGYPKTNDHLKCYTDLPCKIEKGRDEFHNKKKWYVIFDCNINIKDKTYSTVTQATSGAICDYTKYLKEQLRQIEKGFLK